MTLLAVFGLENAETAHWEVSDAVTVLGLSGGEARTAAETALRWRVVGIGRSRIIAWCRGIDG